MKLILQTPQNATKSFLKQPIHDYEMEKFKNNLILLLNKISTIENQPKDESEEHLKNNLRDFLRDTYYINSNAINTKDKKDLVIHIGKSTDTDVAIIIEAKRPSNKNEMITADNANKKALHELILYYLSERNAKENVQIKQLIVTDINQWFIIDANYFDKHIYRNTLIRKLYETKINDRKDNPWFYEEIAKIVAKTNVEIPCVYFDFRVYENVLRNSSTEDDQKLIVALYRILSPQYLLKIASPNDSNSLDRRFYDELLHIIGLREVKAGSKKLIERNKSGERHTGTILEAAIIQLDSLDKLNRIENPNLFGNTQQERLFNLALELSITWVNRILFLKLLESQLVAYHKGDKSYLFLNGEKIKNYDDLNSLFFQVLARKYEERNEDVKKYFEKVPYLNSSLFEPSDLEQITLFISNLKDDKTIPLFSQTVLKNRQGKKQTGNLSTLHYLFEFLDAYDFGAEGGSIIQGESKTLINASVLGLIFEKINGYKDGSFFTPGFITEYMCRETIRKAVVQKFNEAKNWTCKNFDELKEDLQEAIKNGDRINERKKANEIVKSLRICDPAVGSGHFLVSALNEIIAIKDELKILVDKNINPLSTHKVEILNDELVVLDLNDKPFVYNPTNPESQRIQETLFHEKQTIIENCLFGVDINSNSVKICRLRLWIELLKNAYYKNATELETLPNIDINIKCGNSLVSRFAIDADLKESLKKNKWNISSYRFAVSSYRNAKNKEEKRVMEQLIADIKSDFRSEISLNDPKAKNLRKLSGELVTLTTQTSLFEMSKKEKADWNKKVTQLTEETKKIKTEIEEIKANKIFENAFEWRFEFPEVLNDEGDFVGFDVVIGNPPYGVKLIDREKEYLKNRFTATSGEVEIYTFFIELAMADLLKSSGIFSYITTNTIYYLDKFSPIRKKSFLENRIISLLELEKQVFADAPDIVPAIYILQKNAISNNVIKLYKSTETKRVYDLVEFEEFKVNSIEQSKFESKTDFVFSLSTNEAKENLLKRISLLEPVKKSFKVVYGIKTGDNKRFLSKEINGTENWKKCASSAKNIKKYTIDWQGDYLNVCSDLAGLNNINYEQPKILIQYIRKLSMPVRLVCALDKNGEYYPLNNFSFVISENGSSLQVLLGILNSRLMNWYFSNSFVDYNIKPKYIEQLPLPKKIISSELENIITKIITLKEKDKETDTTDLETQADQLVYQLYELTEEEIKIIENA